MVIYISVLICNINIEMNKELTGEATKCKKEGGGKGGKGGGGGGKSKGGGGGGKGKAKK